MSRKKAAPPYPSRRKKRGNLSGRKINLYPQTEGTRSFAAKSLHQRRGRYRLPVDPSFMVGRGGTLSERRRKKRRKKIPSLLIPSGKINLPSLRERRKGKSFFRGRGE